MSRSVEHELATQASHLRDLARALLGRDDGDDLVQDTALQALRVRGEPAAPRAWLATAMRRLAGKQQRAARRRSRRETAFAERAERAERDAAPTPFEAAERRETLLRLTAALMALAEPYRGTLQARYFEELSPLAIAARDGVPVATVKTRLQRGLTLLRERLQQGGGDWRAALVGTFGLRDLTPATPAVVAAGVFVMGTGVKLALGGLAAALFVAAGLWGAGGGGPPAVPVAAAPDRDAVAVVAASESLPSERRVAVAPVAPADEPAAAVAIVHGRCVDAEGEPLAGCVVRVHTVAGGAGRELRWQQRHGAFVWPQPQAIRTDATGTFRVEVPPTGPRVAELEVAADGRIAPAWRWAQLRARDVHDVGDVVVRRLVRVRLQVQNRQGEALPWFSVRFQLREAERDDSRRPLRVPVQTDAHGEAVVRLAEGEQTGHVMCIGADSCIGSSVRLTVPAGVEEHVAAVTVDSLPNVTAIRGSVVDFANRPVAGARIAATRAIPKGDSTWTPFETATTADGSFVIGRPDVETWSGDLDLQVAAENCEQPVPRRVQWGQGDVQFVLAPAVAMEFVVRDPDGAPVRDYDLTLELTTRHPLRWEERHEPGPHADGVVVCDGLPSGDYELTIEPRDPMLCGCYEEPIVVDRASAGFVEIVLARAVRRTLRVQSVLGEPIVGARIERLAGTTRSEDAPPDTRSSALSFQESRSTAGDNQVICFETHETDEDGAAVLCGPAGERFAVRVRDAGHLPMIVHGVDLADPSALVVTMQRGAALQGRLGPAGFVAWIEAFSQQDDEASLTVAMSHGSPASRASAQVASDGTFTVPSLVAGEWRVSLSSSSSGNANMRWDLGTIALEEGQTVARDFDLAAAIPSRLRGTLALDGVPAEGWLSIGEAGRPQTATVELGPGGTFDVWVRPGVVRIDYVNGPDLCLTVADAHVIAAAAAVTHAFDVTTGELRLHLVDGAQAAAPNVRLRWREASTPRNGGAYTDPNGDLVRRIETGTFRLQCLPRSLQSEAALEAFRREHRDDPTALEHRYLDLGTITVLPGDTRTHTIVLPPEYER